MSWETVETWGERGVEGDQDREECGEQGRAREGNEDVRFGSHPVLSVPCRELMCYMYRGRVYWKSSSVTTLSH